MIFVVEQADMRPIFYSAPFNYVYILYHYCSTRKPRDPHHLSLSLKNLKSSGNYKLEPTIEAVLSSPNIRLHNGKIRWYDFRSHTILPQRGSNPTPHGYRCTKQALRAARARYIYGQQDHFTLLAVQTHVKTNRITLPVFYRHQKAKNSIAASYSLPRNIRSSCNRHNNQ